tara:strand:+ start:66 stop:620 length:555 start_codon:yes stop_codon:yes gene_type:complete
MSTCEFELTALELLKYILHYPHIIVFESILQTSQKCTGKKKYISVDDICNKCGLHSRDVMKYLAVLQHNKFVESVICTTNDKKKIQKWGINYEDMFNFILCKLKKIDEKINKKNDNESLFCIQCKKRKKIEDWMNENFEVKCSNDASHILSSSFQYANESKIVKNMINKIEKLIDKKPLYRYVL